MNYKHILESIQINYKSWIVLLACIYLIDRENLIGSFFIFIFLMISAHLLHYASHLKGAYPTNIIHLYHHDHNNWFSHFIQILLEMLIVLYILFFKYLNVPFFKWFNEYIVFFFYFFYTTVHNINYSIFHINRVHELHHEFKIKNIGPDICDILFGTKHEPENGLENTDHYIPNMISGLICVLGMKYFWSTCENKEFYKTIFMVFCMIIEIILIEASVVLLILDGEKEKNDIKMNVF